MRKLVVGNWKMNGVASDLADIAAIAEKSLHYPAVESALCLPATLISRACDIAQELPIGGQDCHMQQVGAHTGCVSADMLVDAGASLTIVGHSERRAAQHEQDHDVLAKAQAAHNAGLKVIICVGETLAERDAGDALHVVLGQVAGSLPENISGDWLSVAYEPVWAIGSGQAATPAQAQEVCAALRAVIAEDLSTESAEATRILYGGSVKSGNIASFMREKDIDGALVGGASLDAEEFAKIVQFPRHVIA